MCQLRSYAKCAKPSTTEETSGWQKLTFSEILHSHSSGGLHLCVGIDPTASALHEWGLEDSAQGAKQFSLQMLEAATGISKIVKPQVAYFERFGARGYQALTDVIQAAREYGLLVIADAKRNDIGSTIDAYSRAWLGDDAPMQVDAITVTPYLGFEALEPLFRRAVDSGSYVFVVARSSNPEGSQLQMHGASPLWHTVLEDIAEWSAKNGTNTIGAVVGATVLTDLKYALDRLRTSYFLAPGIGAQGASIQDVRRLGGGVERVIASSSRALARHGPEVSNIRGALTQMQ